MTPPPGRRGDAPPDVVFVDSSALYALADRGDTWHRAASRVAQQLRGIELITTDLMVTEAWLLTRSRLGWDAAQRLWRGLREGAARVELVTQEDLERAWTISADFADQELSLPDCVSFAFMVRSGIRRAFSFDSDFTLFRYGTGKRQAFDVLGTSER